MGRRKIREIPPREEMVNLYLTEGQRQTDMATHYGVSRDTVKDWLKSYGIEKRPDRRPKGKVVAEKREWTPAEAAPLLRKASASPHGERAKAAARAAIAQQRRQRMKRELAVSTAERFERHEERELL